MIKIDFQLWVEKALEIDYQYKRGKEKNMFVKYLKSVNYDPFN